MLNVWKNVKRYAQDGFTSVIHGKHWHEETRATASQAVQIRGGHYLVVLDRDEAGLVCDFIAGTRRRPDPRGDRSSGSATPRRPGSIRPCTWRGSAAPTRRRCSAASRSRSARCSGRRCVARYGEAGVAERFRAFDTICSATQDRQDAVERMLADETLDLMLVIGGYNSSNTCNLARICAARVPTYHIADPGGLVAADAIRHRDVATRTRGRHPRLAARRSARSRSA